MPVAWIKAGKFELRAIFIAQPQNWWEHIRFVFEWPTMCSQTRLEFIEAASVNFFFIDKLAHQSTGGKIFLKIEVLSTKPILLAALMPPSRTSSRTSFLAIYQYIQSNTKGNIEKNSEELRKSSQILNLNRWHNNLCGGNCLATEFSICAYVYCW